MTQEYGQGGAENLNIQELQARGVNPTWIGKLNEIHNAGIQGFCYGVVKTAQPLQFLTKFSVLAFFFNWIYYLIKGMWKKALFIIGVFVALYILMVISVFLFAPIAFIFWLAMLAFCVYVALAAPGDYYRFVVLKEDFWI